MTCEHDPKFQQEVCGDLVCSQCYLEDLMSSKTRFSKLPALELVYEPTKHSMIMRKKK